MLYDLPFRFDRPGWLLLLVLLVPTYLFARRSVGGLSRTKAYLTFALRAVVLLLLTAALARPTWEKRGKGLTVTIILDRSQSIPLAMKQYALRFLSEAAEAGRRPEDRLAVITVAGDAAIVGMPDPMTRLGEIREPVDLAATDLAAGVRLALALMPDDTANRIVLASDGNETADSVLAAAQLASANDVPIDVLVLEYEHASEVIFERLAAPARARLGQSVNIKLVLRSQGNASGRVTLKMNDEYLDLNGLAEGNAMPVTLEPGLRVLPITVSLDVPGPVQFEAIFESDDDDNDVGINNRAVAVTFVASGGKVLIVDDGVVESQYLAPALGASGIVVDVERADALARGPIFLSGYDAVILANIPRYALTDDEDRALHAYVHDLGGGLVMLGGEKSFGAGGWIDSEVARVLPVKLDPPQTRQMVRGALALIMHSTEMPQGNFWGQKVAISAIEALSRLDYVGIIDYDWNVGGTNWTFPLQEAGDKTRAVAAAKKMLMGDMPDFASAMKLALDGLVGVSAGKKHVIIISDGDPQPPSRKLLDDFIAAQVTVSTVLIAGHGTAGAMKSIAGITGGNFYAPKNPKKLPGIFIKEAEIVSRSLIVEGDAFQPQIVSRLPGPIEGFADVPTIDGYVLTAPREGLSQIPIVNATTEGIDPIYAHWNYGLGKSIAYTSDLTGRWGGGWAQWPEFESFWEQSIRWVMRPSAPANMIVNTTHEGDRVTVDVEALEADASFLNFLRTSAVVLHPDGTSRPLSLQQTGPGRYRGEFRTDSAGAYLVNINFAGGSQESPVKGNIQAAVAIGYPREFRAVKHNAALLAELAQRTGGRELSGGDPALVDLFNRQALRQPASPRSIWDLLVILAAALFLVDVAARRIAVDRRAAAEMASRALGRRREVGTATVAAWKRVAHRRSAGGADASTRFEAQESDTSIAIDVEAQSSVQKPQVGTKDPSRREPTASEGTEEPGEYTSRLLAAKRRARGQSSARPEDDRDG